ncbi:hypothetical protein [Parasediminibacterium sp. JCM 36343]|uniref:hypothetical protein n=1 Tax=Parasediminibacterium sp. JCM 36343 TaxID=3374279 RepID=UPI0039787D21
MSEINAVDILRNYNYVNWIDWIEDILYYGIAYPLNNLTPEGDILIDIVFFLKKNNISTKEYDSALCGVLNKLYGNYNDAEKIIRIINVLVGIKNPKAKEILRKIFFNPELNDLIFNHDSVKAKILQAYARLELDVKEREEVKVHFELFGWKEFPNNIALMGNYLRFMFLHYEENVFLNSISSTIKLTSNLYSEQQIPFVVTLIEDKLREFYYNRKSIFYSHFYEWFSNVYNEVSHIKLFNLIIMRFNKYLNRRNDFSDVDSNESFIVEVVTISLNSIFDTDYFDKQRFSTIADWANFLIASNKRDFLNVIIEKNKYSVAKNLDCYDSSYIYNHEIIDENLCVPLIKQFKKVKSALEYDKNYVRENALYLLNFILE